MFRPLKGGGSSITGLHSALSKEMYFFNRMALQLHTEASKTAWLKMRVQVSRFRPWSLRRLLRDRADM